MTQKIFDVENEEDMDLLWSILPDRVERLTFVKNERSEEEFKCFMREVVVGNDGTIVPQELIKINWHDKTEITRPKNYENVIGCVGWFWDGEQKPARPVLSVLWRCDIDGFWTVRRDYFEHFMTAQKSELKFYGEQDE